MRVMTKPKKRQPHLPVGHIPLRRPHLPLGLPQALRTVVRSPITRDLRVEIPPRDAGREIWRVVGGTDLLFVEGGSRGSTTGAVSCPAFEVASAAAGSRGSGVDSTWPCADLKVDDFWRSLRVSLPS